MISNVRNIFDFLSFPAEVLRSVKTGKLTFKMIRSDGYVPLHVTCNPCTLECKFLLPVCASDRKLPAVRRDPSFRLVSFDLFHRDPFIEFRRPVYEIASGIFSPFSCISRVTSSRRTCEFVGFNRAEIRGYFQWKAEHETGESSTGSY